jgi:orotate phosphoribosyltransferase
MDAVERLAELLLAKVRGAGIQFDTVLAPAMGGLVIGQEVARQAKARYIFAEKENNVLVLRRGFTLIVLWKKIEGLWVQLCAR